MTESVSVSTPSDLDKFIEFLYEDLNGWVYLVAKTPGKAGDWNQQFFQYPEQSTFLKKTILKATDAYEVYIGPALYKTDESARKENVKCSNVVWTDFDGNAPEGWDGEGPPSLIIQSSGERNQHVYWKLNEPVYDIEVLEDTNRRLTYNYGADTSGWDSTQVLRPPHTTNHKRALPVSLYSTDNYQYDITLFDSLAPAPKPVEHTEWGIAELPEAQDVILKYSFPPDVQTILKLEYGQTQFDRSAKLMQLAYATCQMSMSDVEVFVLLRMMDGLWGKFVERTDRDRRLAHIISVARHKYPDADPSEEGEAFTFAFDYKTFLEAKIEVDWVVENMLMDNGNMLMAGPSGIGKTQLTLEFMKHIALGKDFLHYKIPTPKKIGFLSLEMGHPDLQIFMAAQDTTLTASERDLLAENLTIIPHGEPWPLNTEHGQLQLESLIEHFGWEGLFVDSLGSSIIGNINSNDVVQPLTNFNDRIRKKYGLFLWYIHHTRKAQPGANGRIDQDDIYGDQYLNNRASASYGILRGPDGTIKVRCFKSRLAAREDDYLIIRDPTSLTFSKTTQVVDDHNTKQLPTPETKGPPMAGGMLL